MAGTLLTWGTGHVSIPGEGKHATDTAVSAAVKGTSAPVGLVVAALGVILIIVGLAFLLGTGEPVSRMGKLKAAIVPGILILAAVGYVFATKDLGVNAVLQSEAETAGVSASKAQELIAQLAPSGGSAASVGTGVMIAGLGGLLGVVAGILALLGGRRRG